MGLLMRRPSACSLRALAALLALCACAEDSAPPAPANPFQAADEARLRETARVIEAVLRDVENARTPAIVTRELVPVVDRAALVGRVGFGDEARPDPAFAPGRAPPALDDSLFSPDSGVVLVPAAAIEAELFEKGGHGWPGFARRFPGADGYWRFSPVEVDAERGTAFLYVARYRGRLDASGQHVHLTRRDGRWIVTTRRLVWIS